MRIAVPPLEIVLRRGKVDADHADVRVEKKSAEFVAEAGCGAGHNHRLGKCGRKGRGHFHASHACFGARMKSQFTDQYGRSKPASAIFSGSSIRSNFAISESFTPKTASSARN